jgi:hypothetical protein
MALPTPEEVQALVADLTQVAQAYSTSPDLNGYMSRVQVIAKAKKLTVIDLARAATQLSWPQCALHSFQFGNSALTHDDLCRWQKESLSAPS